MTARVQRALRGGSMIITGTEDLRIQKTMASIDNAFSCLLLKSEYGEISIKNICDLAKINKKTFYRYYATVHDLFHEKLEQFSLEFMNRVSKYKLPQDLRQVNRAFFIYASERGSLYERLICHEAYSTYGSRMLRDFVHRTWNTSEIVVSLDIYRKNILLCFLQATGTELYRQWIQDGKAIPLEEIIQLSEALLCNGVQGFLERVHAPMFSM